MANNPFLQALLNRVDDISNALGDRVDPDGAWSGRNRDIQLPNEPAILLDSNRLPEVNQRRIGQNPSGDIDRTTYPLDSSRVPEDGMLPRGSTGSDVSGANARYVSDTAKKQQAAEVLGSFFGSTHRDPALELAATRNKLRQNYEDDKVHDIRAGRSTSGTDQLLSMLKGEADADPFTGVAEQQTAEKTAAANAELAALQNPNSAVSRERAHQEAINLQKEIVSHPNANVNPFSGTQIPNVPGAVPTGQSVAGTSAAASIPAPKGIDPAKWAAQTADLAPESAAKLSALLSYDENIPSGNVLARPEWSAIVGRARMIDPTFDAKQFDTRKSYLQDFAKGKTGQAVTALDTVMHHLDAFDRSAKDLDNSGGLPWSKAYNAFGNWVKENTTGFPEKGAFEDAANAVSGELANVFKSTGATDQEISSWRHQLSASATPEEFKQNVTALTNLIGGRMEAIRKHYGDVMGRQAPEFLSPESQQIWQRFQHPQGGQQTAGGGEFDFVPGKGLVPRRP